MEHVEGMGQKEAKLSEGFELLLREVLVVIALTVYL